MSSQYMLLNLYVFQITLSVCLTEEKLFSKNKMTSTWIYHISLFKAPWWGKSEASKMGYQVFNGMCLEIRLISPTLAQVFVWHLSSMTYKPELSQRGMFLYLWYFRPIEWLTITWLTILDNRLFDWFSSNHHQMALRWPLKDQIPVLVNNSIWDKCKPFN